jgi:hypothetical protein
VHGGKLTAATLETATSARPRQAWPVRCGGDHHDDDAQRISRNQIQSEPDDATQTDSPRTSFSLRLAGPQYMWRGM